MTSKGDLTSESIIKLFSRNACITYSWAGILCVVCLCPKRSFFFLSFFVVFFLTFCPRTNFQTQQRDRSSARLHGVLRQILGPDFLLRQRPRHPVVHGPGRGRNSLLLQQERRVRLGVAGHPIHPGRKRWVIVKNEESKKERWKEKSLRKVVLHVLMTIVGVIATLIIY